MLQKRSAENTKPNGRACSALELLRFANYLDAKSEFSVCWILPYASQLAVRPAPQEAKITDTTAAQINRVNFVFIVVCFVVCGFSNGAHFIKLQFFQKRGVISS